MNDKTLTLLLGYVVAPIKDEGMDAIHVTNLIPPYRLGLDKKWTQFPHLHDIDNDALNHLGVSYDQPSGWFRRIP